MAWIDADSSIYHLTDIVHVVEEHHNIDTHLCPTFLMDLLRNIPQN